jgi:hypothetical protein
MLNTIKTSINVNDVVNTLGLSHIEEYSQEVDFSILPLADRIYTTLKEIQANIKPYGVQFRFLRYSTHVLQYNANTIAVDVEHYPTLESAVLLLIYHDRIKVYYFD